MCQPRVCSDTYGNGRDLLAKADRFQRDVTVLNITMPVLNGIAATYQLRKARSAVRLVFLTVHPQSEFVGACFAKGRLGSQNHDWERISLQL